MPGLDPEQRLPTPRVGPNIAPVPPPRAIAVLPAHLRSPRDSAWLSRGLAALAAQEGLARLIVVDDASPLPLPALPPALPVEVLRAGGRGGPARARNRGIARALALGADVVLFTDHDCVVSAAWARTLLEALEAGGRGVVAAAGVTRALGPTLLDRYQDFSGALNGRWASPGRRELAYAPTCNLAVRASALTDERFDERFPDAAGEDLELCHRLRRRGRIALVPRALVWHDYGYRSTLAGLPRFLAQLRRYAAADALVWRLHPELAHLVSEACGTCDLGGPPPLDPAAYGRPALSRLRPRRLRVPMLALRHLARWTYRRGRAGPARDHVPLPR
jgi:GT2 family glycosyltransferase